MNDFVGNILQNKFYACCFISLSFSLQALNADAQLSAALLCYFRRNWCRNLAAAYCTE